MIQVLTLLSLLRQTGISPSTPSEAAAVQLPSTSLSGEQNSWATGGVGSNPKKFGTGQQNLLEWVLIIWT